MRKTVVGLLVIVFGPVASAVASRILTASPEWLWPAMASASAVAGCLVVLLTDPVHRLLSPIARRRAVIVAALVFVVCGTVGMSAWLLMHVVDSKAPEENSVPLPGGQLGEAMATVQLEKIQMALSLSDPMKPFPAKIEIINDSDLELRDLDIVCTLVRAALTSGSRFQDVSAELEPRINVMPRSRIIFPQDCTPPIQIRTGHWVSAQVQIEAEFTLLVRPGRSKVGYLFALIPDRYERPTWTVLSHDSGRAPDR